MFIFYQATRVFLKLNTRKIYSADGHAVQEMIKMATIFYDAAKNDRSLDQSENANIAQATNALLHEKVFLY